MEDHHLDWLAECFGADFVAQLHAADMTNSATTVMFPAHGLPHLVLARLSSTSGMHWYHRWDALVGCNVLLLKVMIPLGG